MTKEENKKILEQIKASKELLKDLLILEMAKESFSREEIRKVLGKISNERVNQISAVVKKNRKIRKDKWQIKIKSWKKFLKN